MFYGRIFRRKSEINFALMLSPWKLRNNFFFFLLSTTTQSLNSRFASFFKFFLFFLSFLLLFAPFPPRSFLSPPPSYRFYFFSIISFSKIYGKDGSMHRFATLRLPDGFLPLRLSTLFSRNLFLTRFRIVE